MNERIQELIRQHTIISDSYTPEYGRHVLEIFAKLIAKECISKIENEAAQYAEPVWAFELVNDIKEHFGVEE